MCTTYGQVWLIEVNINPAMHTNCDTLSAIVPAVLEETLGTYILAFHVVQHRSLAMHVYCLQTWPLRCLTNVGGASPLCHSVQSRLLSHL